MGIAATRYHDISCGHRVVGHENKCRDLHGHNYRIHFTCEALELDEVGRVVDFGVMKALLCQWVEEHWDHKFLMWDQDPLLAHMAGTPGVIRVPFNPTAENMAEYLLLEVGPALLEQVGTVILTRVTIDETRKCSATAELE
jgi:6-pyruvoyltetrahydropterin/6-carboxytetrahydropterin synthase